MTGDYCLLLFTNLRVEGWRQVSPPWWSVHWGVGTRQHYALVRTMQTLLCVADAIAGSREIWTERAISRLYVILNTRVGSMKELA